MVYFWKALATQPYVRGILIVLGNFYLWSHLCAYFHLLYMHVMIFFPSICVLTYLVNSHLMFVTHHVHLNDRYPPKTMLTCFSVR